MSWVNLSAKDWNAAQVIMWLEGQHLGDWAKVFAEAYEDIGLVMDGATLLMLDEQSLAEDFPNVPEPKRKELLSKLGPTCTAREDKRKNFKQMRGDLSMFFRDQFPDDEATASQMSAATQPPQQSNGHRVSSPDATSPSPFAPPSPATSAPNARAASNPTSPTSPPYVPPMAHTQNASKKPVLRPGAFAPKRGGGVVPARASSSPARFANIHSKPVVRPPTLLAVSGQRTGVAPKSASQNNPTIDTESRQQNFKQMRGDLSRFFKDM